MNYFPFFMIQFSDFLIKHFSFLKISNLINEKNFILKRQVIILLFYILYQWNMLTLISLTTKFFILIFSSIKIKIYIFQKKFLFLQQQKMYTMKIPVKERKKCFFVSINSGFFFYFTILSKTSIIANQLFGKSIKIILIKFFFLKNPKPFNYFLYLLRKMLINSKWVWYYIYNNLKKESLFSLYFIDV